MENPWKELLEKVDENFITKDNKYIIEDDLEVIKRFNSSFKSEKTKDTYEIRFEIHPSHYTGNVNRAKVLLLSTNPRYVESEIETLYKLPAFHKEMIQNLNFETKTLINLDKERIAQGNYWKQKTNQLREDVGCNDAIYKKMALIQFFPYHSKEFRKIAKKYFENGKEYLKTQEYGFNLLREAIEKNKLIIILRSKNNWLKAVPELKAHRDNGLVLEVINYRQPNLTPNNFTNKQDYDLLIETLKK